MLGSIAATVSPAPMPRALQRGREAPRCARTSRAQVRRSGAVDNRRQLPDRPAAARSMNVSGVSAAKLAGVLVESFFIHAGAHFGVPSRRRVDFR